MPLNVQLSETNLQQALALIDEAPGRVRVSVARAMNEAIKWGRRELARDLSAQTRLPQKTFTKSRLRTKNATKAKMTASLWYGGNPMLAEKLGILKPHMTGRELGLVVRDDRGIIYFGRGFWATMPETGHTGYFFRSTPDPDATRRSRLWTEGRAKTFGAENLPIRNPTVRLRPSPDTMQRVTDGINAQFNERVERLLKWEFEKLGTPPAGGDE
jgi:hypothetical protein